MPQHSTMESIPSHKLTPILVPSLDPVKTSSSPNFAFTPPRFPIIHVNLKPKSLVKNKIVIDHKVIRIELVPINAQSLEVFQNTLLAPNMGDIIPEISDAVVKEDDLKIDKLDQISHYVGPNFSSDHRVIQQFPQKSPILSLTCNICGRTMKNSSWLSAHTFAGHDKQIPNCSLCSYTTDTRRKLIQHIKRTHFKTNIYQLSQSKTSFTTKQNQSRLNMKIACQEKIKFEERKKERQENRKRRIEQINLRKENRLIRKKTMEPWLCMICNIKGKTSYKLHMKKHDLGMIINEKLNQLFQCNLCEFQTEKYSNLKIHITEQHAGKRAFSCKSCNKRYISSSALRQHRKWNHEKNAGALYNCTKQGCEKMFRRKDSQRRHIETSEHQNKLKPWKDLSRWQKANRVKKERASQIYSLESSQNYII